MTTKKKGLTAIQLEKMRLILQEKRHQLLDKTRTKLSEVEDQSEDSSGDSADRAQASLDLDLMVDSAARESKELQFIDEALAKIDGGNYGMCEECNTAIAIARLQYVPNAQYCIDCQEKLENQGLLPSENSDEFNLAE